MADEEGSMKAEDAEPTAEAGEEAAPEETAAEEAAEAGESHTHMQDKGTSVLHPHFADLLPASDLHT